MTDAEIEEVVNRDMPRHTDVCECPIALTADLVPVRRLSCYCGGCASTCGCDRSPLKLK